MKQEGEDSYRKYMHILEKHFKSSDVSYTDEHIESLIKSYEVKPWKPLFFVIVEELCKGSAQFMKVDKKNIKPEIYKELQEIIKFTELDVKPEYFYSMSYFMFVLFSIILSPLVFFITFFNFIITFFVFVIGLFFLLFPVQIARFLYLYRIIRALDESVLAILYLSVYMRFNPNLENALLFTSKNLYGPLKRDFYRIIWDVITRKKSSVVDGLLEYTKYWKELKPDFVDAIELVIGSVMQKEEERRVEMLSKAVDKVLDGTYRQLIRFSIEMKTPVTALYMLGMTLPLLTLILLPIAAVFTGGTINMYLVFFLYDVVLPIMIFALSLYIFVKKPLGFYKSDVREHPDVPPLGYFYLKIGKKKHLIDAKKVCLPLLVLGSAPTIFYIVNVYRFNKPPSIEDIYMGIPFVATLGWVTSLYFYLISKDAIVIERLIRIMEKEFGTVAFSLASKMDQGIPPEIAMEKTLEYTKKLKIHEMIVRIVSKIKNLGISLDRALFGKEHGIMKYYPSNIIRSSFTLLVSASKKSVYSAASAMQTVSEYLSKMFEVEARFFDLLADIVSSLNFQTRIVAPIVIGVVVAIDGLMVIIMWNVGQQIKGVEGAFSGLKGPMAEIPNIMGLFSLQIQVPLTVFEIAIFLYLALTTIIVSFILKELEGASMYRFFEYVYRTLSVATLIFIIVVIGLTFIFGNIISSIVAAL